MIDTFNIAEYGADKSSITFPRYTAIACVELHLSLELLREFFDDIYQKLWENFSPLPDAPHFVSFPRVIHPQLQTIYQQILHCPYHSSLKHLYLESKVLELITVEFGCLYAEIFGQAPTSVQISSRNKTDR